MFGVKFFFVNIFEGLLQNLGELVEIGAGAWVHSVVHALDRCWLVAKEVFVCVAQGQVPHFSDKLLLKVFSVVNFRLVQVKQEQQEKCYQVTFKLYVSYPVDVEENVSVDLRETQ